MDGGQLVGAPARGCARVLQPRTKAPPCLPLPRPPPRSLQRGQRHYVIVGASAAMLEFLSCVLADPAGQNGLRRDPLMRQVSAQRRSMRSSTQW